MLFFFLGNMHVYITVNYNLMVKCDFNNWVAVIIHFSNSFFCAAVAFFSDKELMVSYCYDQVVTLAVSPYC